jgi:hypothetical protein
MNNTIKIRHDEIIPGDRVFVQGLLLDVLAVWGWKHPYDGCVVIRYDAKLHKIQTDPINEKYRNTIFDCGYGASADCEITIIDRDQGPVITYR